jgi:hypothetical protein
LETLLVITYTLLFIFLIHKLPFFKAKGISRNVLSAIFVLKLFFGCLVWVVYTYYYTYRPTADVFKYFDASEILFNTLKTNPIYFFKMLFGIDCDGKEFYTYYDQMNHWNRAGDSSIYNDNRLIIRVNAVMRFFSFGYFHVHTVFFSFLSLTGLTAVYKTFVPVLKNKKRELLCVVFLMPSVLFWGSGVLKEGLVLFSLGLLMYYFNKLFSVKAMIICVVTALLLGTLKFYILVALVPGLLFMFWMNNTSPSNVFLKFATVIAITLVLGLTMDKFSSVPNPLQLLSKKQEDFNKLATGTITDAYKRPIPPAGSTIQIKRMEPTFLSFLRNSPQALVNSLFRPFIWQYKAPIMWMASIENVFVIAFVLVCIVFAKPYNQISWQYVLFCLSFALIQLLFIGITTPVVGAIVRYKIIAIPFLLIAFLLMLDKEKINQTIKTTETRRT